MNAHVTGGWSGDLGCPSMGKNFLHRLQPRVTWKKPATNTPYKPTTESSYTS